MPLPVSSPFIESNRTLRTAYSLFPLFFARFFGRRILSVGDSSERLERGRKCSIVESRSDSPEIHAIKVSIPSVLIYPWTGLEIGITLLVEIRKYEKKRPQRTLLFKCFRSPTPFFFLKFSHCLVLSCFALLCLPIELFFVS